MKRKSKKLIITGSNGMLGSYVHTYFIKNNWNISGLTRKNFDITKNSYDEIKNEILKNSELKQENIIINCAGLIPQRGNTKNSDMILINSVFPHWLQNICEDSPNYKLINITTDCVFSGMKGDYTEKDIHDATYLYGRSKSIGEPSNAMNVRTSIIGEELYNKVSLLEWVKSKKDQQINGFIDHIWNGVTCLELAKQIEYFIKNDISWEGNRHIFSTEKCSKFQLVEYISRIWDLNLSIIPYNTEKVDKSLSTIYTNFVTKNIQEQLYEIKNFYI